MNSRSRSNSESSTKTRASTGSRTNNKLKKERMYVENTCYICGNILSGASQTLGHIERMHGYSLPSREVGRRRPQDRNYEYVRDKNMEYDIAHYGCPSCWFHCSEDDLDALNKHTRDEHENEIEKVDIAIMDNYRSRRSRSNSVSSTRMKNKSFDIKEKDSNTEKNSGAQSIDKKEKDTTTEKISKNLDELTDLFKKFFKQNKKN